MYKVEMNTNDNMFFEIEARGGPLLLINRHLIESVTVERDIDNTTDDIGKWQVRFWTSNFESKETSEAFYSKPMLKEDAISLARRFCGISDKPKRK